MTDAPQPLTTAAAEVPVHALAGRSVVDRWSGPFLFALFALLYASTATRTIQGGDTAELVWTATAGGVPHPPGYPLYVLLGRLLSWLPLGTPPWRAALVSVLAMAGAVAVLARALGRATASVPAACVTAVVFGASPLTFRLASLPEVFALNALFAACLVWMLVWVVGTARAAGPRTPRSPGAATGNTCARPTRILFLTGLLFGLGLANHHTLVLLAPVGVTILIVEVRAFGTPGRLAGVLVRLTGAGLLGLLIGLSPYATLLLAARSTCADPQVWCWGDTGTPAGLLRHFLRQEFGTFSLGLATRELRSLDEIGDLFLALGAQGFGAGALLSLLGIGLALRRDTTLGLTLVISLLLAGPLFVARFNLPDTALGHAIAERFYLLPLLLLTAFSAWPLAWSFSWLGARGRAGVSSRWFLSFSALVLVAVLAVLVWRGARATCYAEDGFIERYLRAALSEVDRDAVILGMGDEDLFGYGYLLVKGPSQGPFNPPRGVPSGEARQHNALSGPSERSDVRYLDLHLLRLPWYHARARRELPGFSVPFSRERTPVFPILEQLLRLRPVYVTRDVRALLPVDISYPEGLLYRVRFIDDPMPALDSLRIRAERALDRLGDALNHTAADVWSVHARGKAVAPALDLARALEAAGEPASTARLRDQAAAFVTGAHP